MTLIEQIMVLVIVAILAGVAAPSLRQLLSSNQLRVAQVDFISALRHARETAITSDKRVVFCPTHDGSHCSDDTRWEHGWLLGHDANHDDQPDEGTLHVGHGYNGKLTIHSSSGRHIVRFYPNGSASGSNITLLFCPASGKEQALSVVVSNSGRIRGAPASAEQTATCTQNG